MNITLLLILAAVGASPAQQAMAPVRQSNSGPRIVPAASVQAGEKNSNQQNKDGTSPADAPAVQPLGSLELSGHENFVESISWSRDGSKLATASMDKTVKVWDASTGRELLTLRGHKDTERIGLRNLFHWCHPPCLIHQIASFANIPQSTN